MRHTVVRSLADHPLLTLILDPLLDKVHSCPQATRGAQLLAKCTCHHCLLDQVCVSVSRNVVVDPILPKPDHWKEPQESNMYEPHSYNC